MQIRPSGEMQSKSVWPVVVRQTPKSKSSKNHLEISLEDGFGPTNCGCGKQYFAVQIQLQIPAAMGRKEWAMEFRQQPIVAVQMEKRLNKHKHHIYSFPLLGSDLGAPV